MTYFSFVERLYTGFKTIQGHDHSRSMSMEVFKNKKGHGLKAQPLKDFILGSSPNVNRKLLTHILTNVPTHFWLSLIKKKPQIKRIGQFVATDSFIGNNENYWLEMFIINRSRNSHLKHKCST